MVLPVAEPPAVIPPVVMAAMASWALLAALIPQLRRRLLDQPNARSSHQQPTPRGGGLAFVLVAAVASGVGLLQGGWAPPIVTPLITLPLALIGFLDDRHNLPASWRYGVQLATALLLLQLSPLVRQLPAALLSKGWLVLLSVFVLLLIAVTAVINFTNFMDGLDGLVAGCMAVTVAAIALTLTAPWPLWSLVGALLGFLLWNWRPAKVFMGDVGSTFLGAVFAGLVLQAPSWPEALGLLLVATPLLGDACLCVPRRLLAGQRVFEAHRLHLFQRLHQAGWSHGRVSSLYIGATALLAAALRLGGWTWVTGCAAMVLLTGMWLDRRMAMPFAVASRS
jgi:Fuc2NAc and GlcNAc transferase